MISKLVTLFIRRGRANEVLSWSGVNPDGVGFSAAWLGAKKILVQVSFACRVFILKPPVFHLFPSPLELPYPCRLAVLRGCAESCAAGALACGMILFPVPPSCPSRFPQLGPCGVLSLLCLFLCWSCTDQDSKSAG